MIKEKFIEIVLVILLIILAFVIFISIIINNTREEKIARAEVNQYLLPMNKVLSIMEQQLYDGMDFEFIYDVSGDKKEVNFHDGVYDILEDDVLIDSVKKEDGQDVIKEIEKEIPFKVSLIVKLKGNDYTAQLPPIVGESPEEAYKITVNKDAKYVKVTENSDLISLEFK